MVPGPMPGMVPRTMCRSVPQMALAVSADDGVGGLLDFGLRHVVQPDVPNPVKDDCLHCRSFPPRGTGRSRAGIGISSLGVGTRSVRCQTEALPLVEGERRG